MSKLSEVTEAHLSKHGNELLDSGATAVFVVLVNEIPRTHPTENRHVETQCAAATRSSDTLNAHAALAAISILARYTGITEDRFAELLKSVGIAEVFEYNPRGETN